MKMIKKTMRFLSVPLLCGLGVFLLFRFVLFLGYVPSASMEPTISTDSLIIGNRFYGELQRGDIVIFERNGTCLVKRIAAIPGDTVYLDDQTHTVSVNVKTENATRVLEIPEDSYFMLGDNAAVSIDSRYWENPFISKDDVQARVILSE
jgi:signal peptidase I